MQSTIAAAGAALWRPAGDGLEIALVHRPKYDDWSLPKGTAKSGEHLLATALREVAEETGAVAAPGRRLGRTRYLLEGRRKRVTYWAMRYVSGSFSPSREVDEVTWLPAEQAIDRLRYEHDRLILAELLRDPRPTHAAVVVRHASAGSRQAWKGPDEKRPLDKRGRRQADGLVPLLDAYGPTRAVSADVARCLLTLEPWARHAAVEIEQEHLFSEQGYAESPQAAERRLTALIRESVPAVFATQGGALPDLVERTAAGLGAEVHLDPVRKGALVVLHVSDQAEVVAVDQLPSVPT